MNHTLLPAFLACAVSCTLCNTAAAQSTVTIFGLVDMGVGRLNDGTSGTVAPTGQLNRGPGLGAPSLGGSDQWSARQSTASRIGFRGVEELGGGLKALFNIEHRFTPDDGIAGAPFWGGRSTVALQSSFGEVYLGRDYIPAFYIGINLDPWAYDLNVGALQTPYTLAGYSVTVERGVRTSNTVGYKTPSIGGFSAQLATGLGEGARKRVDGANLLYRQGPVYAGIATDRSDGDNNVVVAGVSYDFGVVRPMFITARTKALGRTTRSLGIGATMPIRSGVLKVAYGQQDQPGANDTTKKLGLGYEYFLSKRTSVHADAGTAKHPAFTRVAGFEAGMKHTF